MYTRIEDISDLMSKAEISSENPGIFIEYMGKCFEPDHMYIDDDGDIIIRI